MPPYILCPRYLACLILVLGPLAFNRKPASITLIPNSESWDPRDLRGVHREGQFSLETWGPTVHISMCQSGISGWEE